MTNQLNIKLKTLSAAEYGEFISRGKMPSGEEAARRYLGRKYAEKMARINRLFLAGWFCLLVGAIVAPFIILMGV
jgi:hypothetical protein